MSAPPLGTCAAPWCDRDAVVYVAGPTAGTSPRVTVIGGQRAAVLANTPGDAGWENVRCIDCAQFAVEEAATGHVAPPPQVGAT